MFLKKKAAATLWFILAGLNTAVAQPVDTEAPIKARLHQPVPYELNIGTFIGITLQSVAPEFVMGVVSIDVYDNFKNVAIPRGSRLFGHQQQIVNGLHDIIWTEIQLADSGATYQLQPALPATTPLGSRGLKNFRVGASAGAQLISNLIIPHE